MSQGPGKFVDDDLYLSSYYIEDKKELSPLQRLLLALLKEFSAHNFRRYYDRVYKEIRILQIRDADGNLQYITEDEYTVDMCRRYDIVHSFGSHAWEPANKGNNDMKTMIYHFCSKDSYLQRWKDLTSTTVTKVASHLIGCRTYDFPDLKPDRLIRTFKNGIFVIRPNTVEFLNFLDLCEVPSNMVSCKYISQEFDLSMMEYYNWYNVPTPVFDSILKHQEWNALVRNQIYTQLGRTFFSLNTYDKWEIIPFFKGVAGSGKSTIGRLMMKFYNKEDVGILSSNMEAQFGLEPIYEKLLYMCLEVTNTFKLNRADFQSMISGEDVSVAGKHKTAKTVRWNTPGLFFGNELGPWQDSAGSITRRLLVFELNNRVTEVDTEMDAKLTNELPQLLFKFIQAYQATVTHCGSKGIWQIVPQYLIKVKERIAINTNPIKRFIYSGTLCLDITRDDYMIPWHMFQCYLNTWVSKRGTKPNFSIEQIVDIVEQSGLRLIELTQEDTKDMDHNAGKFVVGIKIRDDEDQNQTENAGTNLMSSEDDHKVYDEDGLRICDS